MIAKFSAVLILRERKLSTRIFLVLSFCCLLVPSAISQVNLSGKPGLLYVPSAESTPEGTLYVGAVYNPLNYALGSPGRKAEAIMFANLTILPRLDININVLKGIGNAKYKVIKDLGDRQLDIKYLLLKEKGWRPAVAVIMSSPFSVDAIMLTHVIVASKTYELGADWRVVASAGIGSPYFVYRNATVRTNSSIFSKFRWQKKSEYKHDNQYLVGVFGGAKLDFRQKAGFMLEFDSRHINAGGYVKLFDRWVVQAGLINLDQLSVGTAYSFSLQRPSRGIKKLYEEER